MEIDEYTEKERSIIQIGNSIGTTLNPEFLRLLEMNKGDKLNIRYSLITKEIIISGV